MPALGHNIPNALAAQTLGAPAAAEAGSGGGAALTAQYLTLAADVHLTSERVFTPGSGLAGVDGGAGLLYTLSADASVARNTWAVGAGAGLTGGGNLAAAGITLDVGAGSGISVAANAVAVDQSFAFGWTGLQTWSQLAVFNAGARIAAGQALQFGTDVSLDRKGADILELGVGDNVESRTYTSGLAGWHLGADGSAEFENVRVRGELSASVFRISEITATAGTLGVFKSAATLYVDYTAPGSIGSSNTLTARNSLAGGSLLAAADRFRIKAWDGSAIRDLWLSVTSVGTNHGDNTDYTVKLESGTTGVTFAAGTALADYGPSGAGFITLSADGTIGSSANVSIADHAGSPWSATTLRARLGNLNGSYGIATDLYGFGTGDFSGGNYLRYDPTNGFVLKAGAGAVTINASGVAIATAAANSVPNSYQFVNGSGTGIGHLYGVEDATSDAMALQVDAVAGKDAFISILAARGTGSTQSIIELAASQYAVLQLVGNGTTDYANLISRSGAPFAGLLIGSNLLGLTAPGAMLDVRGAGLFTGTLGVGGSANDAADLQMDNAGTSTSDFQHERTIGVKNTLAAAGILANTQIGALVFISDNGSPAAGISAHYNNAGLRTPSYLRFLTNNTVNMTLSTAGNLTVVGGFGCNTKAAQAALASGGAVVPGAGAFGASSAVNFAALVTLVTNIRTALVNNGIMS